MFFVETIYRSLIDHGERQNGKGQQRGGKRRYNTTMMTNDLAKKDAAANESTADDAL